MKKKVEPKQITAQPVGQGYFVREAGREHVSMSGADRGRRVSDNRISVGLGCFRRIPTCRD